MPTGAASSHMPPLRMRYHHASALSDPGRPRSWKVENARAARRAEATGRGVRTDIAGVVCVATIRPESASIRATTMAPSRALRQPLPTTSVTPAVPLPEPPGAARKRKRGGRVSVECSTQRARWMRYVRLPRASRERSRGSDRRAGMTRIRPDGPGAMRTRTRVRHQRPGWSCQRSYSVQRTRRSCDTFGRSSPTPRATTRRRYVRRLDAMPPPPPRFACAAVAAAVVVMISSWIWIATAPRSAERLFYTRFLNQHASGGCERARARAADY